MHHSDFQRTEWPERTPAAGVPVRPAGGGVRGSSGRLQERRARPSALSGANLSQRPSAGEGRETSQYEAYASGHRRSPQKGKKHARNNVKALPKICRIREVQRNTGKKKHLAVARHSKNCELLPCWHPSLGQPRHSSGRESQHRKRGIVTGQLAVARSGTL